MTVISIIFSIIFAIFWVLIGTLLVYLMEGMIYKQPRALEPFSFARFFKRLIGAILWPIWIFIGWHFY